MHERTVDNAIAYIEELFRGNAGGHDAAHTMRVYRNAMRLADALPDCDRELVVCDRATLFNMLIGLNGYTICSGVISEELNGPNIIAKPLEVDDYMKIGYILPSRIHPSSLTEEYILALKRICKTEPQKEK